MSRRSTVAAAAALCLTLIAGPAVAADDGKVDVRYTDLQIDFGSLHISGNLFGYELSSEGGLISSLMVAFELGDAFMVRAQSTFPFLGVVGSAKGPARVEAGVSFHGTSIDVEKERVELSRTRTGDTVHVEWIDVPALNRNSHGLGAGLMYRSNQAEVKVDGDEVDTRAHHLTGYVGYSFLNASGFSIEAKGHGGFGNYRWLNGGLDLLVDITQTYGVEPDEDPGRFGGRLWAESIFGPTWGLSGRIDVGYMPGDMGFYLMATVGFGFHAL